MSAKALRRTAISGGALASVVLGLVAAPATHASTADVSVKWEVVQDWGSGYQVKATLTNNTNTPIDPWEVNFPYEPQVLSIWDAQRQTTTDGVAVSAPKWQSALAPGASTSFGFIGSAQAGQAKAPATCEVERLTCQVNGGDVSDNSVPETPAADGNGSGTPATDGTAPGNVNEPAPEPSEPSTPSDPTAPSEPGTPSDANDDPTSPSEAVISVAVSAASDWGSGRTMDLKVTNESGAAIDDWSVSMPWAGTISSMWNAKGGLEAGVLRAGNESWNGRLAPGATISVGFGDSGAFVIPNTCTAQVGGATVPCEVSNAATTPSPDAGVAQPTDPAQPAPGDTTQPAPGDTTQPGDTAQPAPGEPATPQPTPVDPAPAPSGPAVLGERKVIGYYPAWGTYSRNYQVADIPGEKVSHINYAFANISGGKCVLGDSYADIDKAFAGDTWDTGVLRGNFNQLIKLRERNPHLQTMISLGGWTWSSNFSEVAATPQSRKAFVDSCVEFMERYEFDGIDVDWEYPVSGGMTPGKPEDKANYTLLMQEFRAALDAEEVEDGRDYWLSIAAPAGPSTLNNLQLPELAATMDWMNLMSYDFHGGWDNVTGHNAPMVRSNGDPSPVGFSVTEAVETYLARGVPAEKLVLGVPFYGRGWNTDGTANAGLYQSGKGTALGTWEAASFDYTDLVSNYLPTMDRYWDEQAQVPYLFDPQRKLFITYDDPQSIAIKAEYINELGLGGAMFWELSGDRDEELLDALNATLE